MSLRVGAAVRDVTPDRAWLSGFAARSEPSGGVHDPITVRALVVADTAVVTVDVCGLDAATCTAIREASGLPASQVVVHSTHTHGGPASMPGRLEARVDQAWLARVVDAAADAVRAARRSQVEATLSRGVALDPGVGKNRRRPDGPTDPSIPVLAFEAAGRRIATLVSHACHPVVLGPDNLQLTADFPGVVRSRIERVHPDSVALFLTGCAGDVNTGHTAEASMRGDGSDLRTFAEAARIGAVIAIAALAAPLTVSTDEAVSCSRELIELPLERPTAAALADEERRFAEGARSAASASERALYGCWRDWAARMQADPLPDRWAGSVTLMKWGDARLAFLPGEPFAAVALQLRADLDDPALFVAGYSDDCPGYLPTTTEYPLGGYEVDDAHRYYGAAGQFAPGSAEQLMAAVTRLAR